jgi:hypothetical protein
MYVYTYIIIATRKYKYLLSITNKKPIDNNSNIHLSADCWKAYEAAFYLDFTSF